MPGATTAQLAAQAVPGGGDVVVVEAGTNDFLFQTPRRRFADDYRALLAKVTAASPGAKLVCLTTWVPKDVAASRRPRSPPRSTTRRSGVPAPAAPWRTSRRSSTRNRRRAGPRAAPRSSAPATTSTRTPPATPRSRGDRVEARCSRAAQIVDPLRGRLDLPQRGLVDGLLVALAMSPFAADGLARARSRRRTSAGPARTGAASRRAASARRRARPASPSRARLCCAVPICFASSFGCCAWVIPSVVCPTSCETAWTACSSSAQAARSSGDVRCLEARLVGVGVAVAAAAVAVAVRRRRPPCCRSRRAARTAARTHPRRKSRMRR